jgi:hypothetical protein
MAEKAYMKHAFLITLTYRNNENGTKPDGARTFVYRHVQLFLKRVRKAYNQKYDATGEISYIIAGERGSQKDRVHWHMVLFSKRPIDMLGEWTDHKQKPVTDWLGNIVNRPIIGKKKRCHWSFWEHGHVNVLRPDRKGMAYVVKYCLKDSFNVVNSKGTAREGKAENHGASYFRMSKKPPIGQRYLRQKLESWAERGVVPPELEITIPDYRGGYWYPKGKLRDWLLGGVREINEAIKAATGKDAAGWRPLLASVWNDEKDADNLLYSEPEPYLIDEGKGEEEIEKEKDKIVKKGFEHVEEKTKKEANAASVWLGKYEPPTKLERDAAETICKRLTICATCQRLQTVEDKEEYRLWLERKEREYLRQGGVDRLEDFEEWYKAKKQFNPNCRKFIEFVSAH